MSGSESLLLFHLLDNLQHSGIRAGTTPNWALWWVEDQRDKYDNAIWMKTNIAQLETLEEEVRQTPSQTTMKHSSLNVILQDFT